MRRKIGPIAFLGLTLALPGCVSADDPRLHTTLSTDEFSKTVAIESPWIGENPFGGVSKLYELITQNDKTTHQYAHVVTVWVSYDDDPFIFQFAADDTAAELPLVRTSRAKRPCSTCDRDETFDITVPDAALRSHVATGYRIKVSSAGGQAIILTISPEIIATQLADLDEFLKTGAISQH